MSFHSLVWAGRKHLANWVVLHLDTSIPNGCSSGMSNSNRSRWKLTEQTMIRVRINFVQHTQCSSMTSMTQIQESLIRVKPGHRIHLALEKLKRAFSSRPAQRRTILKGWENKCIVATKHHRGVHKDRLHQPQNTNSLRVMGDNITHIYFEDEPAVKLPAKNVKVGTSTNGNPGQDQVTMGGLTIRELLTTKALVLLGFSIMQVRRRQQQQVCLLACKQLPVIWSHQHRHIVCSRPAQTFR